MHDDALLTARPTTTPAVAVDLPALERAAGRAGAADEGPAAPARPARVLTLPGVYGPADDTRLLAAVIEAEDLRDARVLDLCTGSGFLAVTAARAGAREVVAVDVSRRAALTARTNLLLHRGRGAVRRGDLLAAADDGLYDVIVSNPPYVPAEGDDLPTRGRARAWDGGRDGRAVVDRICAEAPARLRPGGRLLLVHSHVTDVDESVRRLEAEGLRAEVAVRREIPFGPVMRRREHLLRDAGLHADARRVEEIVVVRAVAPADPAAPSAPVGLGCAA